MNNSGVLDATAMRRRRSGSLSSKNKLVGLYARFESFPSFHLLFDWPLCFFFIGAVDMLSEELLLKTCQNLHIGTLNPTFAL